MKYKFYDTVDKKWLKNNKTPYGSTLVVRNGYVYRKEGNGNFNKRYLAQKQ